VNSRDKSAEIHPKSASIAPESRPQIKETDGALLSGYKTPMRFTPEFLDELRSRLSTSEVVGKRVALKKAGREWRGLSPFNKERTPSFYVNDEKGMWFDFSSGRNGSIFDFLMATEGCTFPEAVERLALEAGMALPQVSERAQMQDRRRRTLHEVVNLAAEFFQQTLAARAGAKARGYLADRGLDGPLQQKFRIGYAPPERFALKEHLGSHGVPVEDMVEAGLLVAGDDIPVPYDRFRDRVMFPITDMRGRLIAFGGRALEKDVAAKYLNSPETPLFHKGANLYNGAAARAAAHKGAPVVAVEGYVDVIAMVACGVEGAVAPLGTALTPEQLGLLWKMTDEPVLCFDGDGAGRRAAYRAVDTALPLLKPGKSLSFAALPDGQDPDDLARSGGRAAIDVVLKGARPMAEMLWLRETAQGAFTTPERRAALEARLAEVVAGIGDETVRRHYRQDLDERLRRLFGGERPSGRRPYGTGGGPASGRGMQGRMPGRGAAPMRGQGGGRGGRPGAFGEPLAAGEPYMVASPQLAASSLHRGYRVAVPPREALILQIVLHHPWLLHDHLEQVSALEFRHGEAERLKAALVDIAAHDSTVHDGAAEPERLAAELRRRGFADALDRIAAAITTAAVFGARPDAAPDDVETTWKQLVSLHNQSHSLTKELREAEQALGGEPSEAHFAWLTDVKQRLAALDGAEALIEGFGASSGRSVRVF